MPHFHELKVRSVERDTEESAVIEFECPPELADEFSYAAGQHVGLKRRFDGREQRRTYSICCAEAEGRLRIGVRHVPDGVFSSWLNTELQSGDTLAVMTPTGHFGAKAKAGDGSHYVAFAAGSGITPVLSLLKTRLDSEPTSVATLFFGNRTRRTVMLLDQVEGLKNRYPARFAVHHILSREKHDIDIHEGRIDGEKCGELWNAFLQERPGDEYFVCGPATMIEDVKNALVQRGVDEERIHFERFGVRRQPAAPAQPEPSSASRENPVRVAVTVDGVRNEFGMDDSGLTVLEAAQAAGIDLPYSCTAGVCSTCRAKLVEGAVDMRVNYALEDWETEAGFILTCQSTPLTKTLALTYDEQ